jgi:pimeloyl-ACP methyl ester carboxylesterase
MTLTATQLGLLRSAGAQPSKTKPADLSTVEPGTNTSFASLKQIDAGVLNVGYAEAGPTDGPAVVLLHGWPYDIHSYVDVAPLLASAGYRMIVPYLRGYATTRFLLTRTKVVRIAKALKLHGLNKLPFWYGWSLPCG